MKKAFQKPKGEIKKTQKFERIRSFNLCFLGYKKGYTGKCVAFCGFSVLVWHLGCVFKKQNQITKNPTDQQPHMSEERLYYMKSE